MIAETWQYLLYGLILVPIISYFQAKVSMYLKKKDAYNDLLSNPYCKIGATILFLKEKGNPEFICKNATIIDLRYGLVKLLIPNSRDVPNGYPSSSSESIMRFTCQEWKELHPVYKKE